MRKVTVLAPSFVLVSIVAIVPALARIADAFPDESATSVQMLAVLPSLVAFPVILLSGALAGVIRKKQIVIVSILLMLAGGLLPVLFYQSFPFLLICGAVFGLGLGGVSPMTTALVYEHYPHKQATMMGYMGSCLCVGGMVFSFLGGWLASYHWRYAYLAYLLLIPVLAAVLMLPKGSVVKSTVRFTGLFTAPMVYCLAQCVITTIGYNIFNTNIAMYIEDAGFGGARMAGIVTSAYSAAGIAGGIFTGRIIGKLRGYTLPALFLVAGIGMLGIRLSPSLALVVTSAFIVGFTFSVFMPAGYDLATRSAPPGAATPAIAVYCCSHQLGQFLTPIVINGAASAVGGVAVKFLFAFLILTGMFVISSLRERLGNSGAGGS
jgi:MFS family permease